LQHGCKEGFRVDCCYSNLLSGGAENNLTARYDTHSLAFSFNGVGLGTRSELSKIMPCRYLGPRVQDLVIGPPKLRRGFLDWGLFHVKHIPLTVWLRYKKAVQLRIASMRRSHPARVIEGIEIDIAQSGMKIAKHRRDYCESLDFKDVNSRSGMELAFEYRDAFDSTETAQALLYANRKRDAELGY
jgi:DNA replication and repair protein RecF